MTLNFGGLIRQGVSAFYSLARDATVLTPTNKTLAASLVGFIMLVRLTFVLRWLGRRMERAVQRAFQENTMQESRGSDHNPYSATSQKKNQSTKEPVGEYIDYEEID